MPKISLIASQLIFVILLIFFMLDYAGFPGVDPEHPLGFFGWYDQGQYLKQLNNLMINGVSELNSGTYPPGYAVLAVPIAILSQFFTDNYAEHSIIALNTILVISSVIIFSHTLDKSKAVFFLIMLSFFIIFSDVVRNSVIIPWTSSVTLFVTSLFYYIIFSDRIMFKKRLNGIAILFFYGAMLSILLHTRPQDFVIISFSSFLYLIFTFYKYNSIGRNLYVPFLSFVLLEIVFYLLADGLSFGNIYVNSDHSFSISGNFDKLLGIISGDQTYGVLSQGLLDRGVNSAIAIVTIFIAGVIFSRAEIKVALILWFVIYLSFSDFGPHNFLRFELFHYLKTPFILSLAVFINSFTYKKMFALSVLTFSTLLLHANISFANILYKTEKISANESIWEVSANDNIDGIFIFGLLPELKKNSPNIFFVPPAITINKVKLIAFKDYRVFVGVTGIYIHFFSDQPYHYRLTIDTTNLKIIPGTDVGVFSFNKSVGIK